MEETLALVEKELKKEAALAREQGAAAIDRAADLEERELVEAREAAEEDYREQRERIDLEEALAKDAQVLYTQSRGDRGGIGAAQYDAIANTAAENRLKVSQAQRKLAADTAEKIAALRARGEYEKADQALSLTQDYLARLRELRQWAAEYRLSEEKLAQSLSQWQAEYDLKAAELEADRATRQAEFDYKTYQSDLKQAGQALLDLGILPSDSQLKALGYTRQQAQDYLAAAKAAGAVKAQKRQNAANSDTQSIKPGGEYALYLAARESRGDPRTYVKGHYKDYGLTALPAESAYGRWEQALAGPLSAGELERFLGKMSITLSEDTKAAADAFVAKYWPDLTAQQRKKVEEVYRNYGKTYVYGG